MNDHLTWDNHIKTITGSCYGTLASLKKFKKMAPFNLRKQLAESLFLSKIDYGDIVYTPLTVAQHKRLQKVQFAAASFVTGNYVRDSKIILNLGWLPIKERRELNLLKTTFKAMNYESWPVTLEEKILPESFDQTVQDHLRSQRKPELSRIMQQNCLILCPNI